ncbi:secreted signal peptide protein [Paracidovorax konjaci]|uniref:Secreted signal peptide protein n=1 Tax=Paracidovorax konjaci TaxID=32040 RepID=A0A1I1WUU9_9BURK|nr:secreted signal peptide protein [Paracidovorax konjaci]SFD97223.1 hypothetical protein SAMN04489710_110161 [Paracidovorax konjaci]
MLFRSLPLFGTLAFGMVLNPACAAGADAAACPGALHAAFAVSGDASVLPATCRHIGPVALGMGRQEVSAALGPPDVVRTDAAHPGTVRVVYLYPRGLNAQLAARPRPAGAFRYGELALRFRDGRVTNAMAYAPPGVAFPFDLLGDAAGAQVGAVLQAIGGQPQWNASRDYVQFAAMPVGIDIDPATSRVIGLGVADSKQDLYTFGLPALRLTRDAHTGLVSGVH